VTAVYTDGTQKQQTKTFQVVATLQ
jgi:hypothetical protein